MDFKKHWTPTYTNHWVWMFPHFFHDSPNGSQAGPAQHQRPPVKMPGWNRTSLQLCVCHLWWILVNCRSMPKLLSVGLFEHGLTCGFVRKYVDQDHDNKPESAIRFWAVQNVHYEILFFPNMFRQTHLRKKPGNCITRRELLTHLGINNSFVCLDQKESDNVETMNQ